MMLLLMLPSLAVILTGNSQISPHPTAPITRNPLRTLKGHYDVIFAAAFSHDASMLATTSVDGSTICWDTEDWTPRFTVKASARSVAFSANDKLLAVGNGSAWDTETGERRPFPAIDNRATAICFSPDGKMIAAARTESAVV